MKNFLKKFTKNLLLVLKYTGIGLFCLIVGFGVFACLRAVLIWLYYFIVVAWPILLTLAVIFILFALGFSILDKEKEEAYNGLGRNA